MTLVALAFAAIFGMTAAGILIPVLLRRQAAGTSRAEQAAGVLRDKLAQVDRDRAEGLIGPAEAAAAQAEIGRALLANAREAERQARGGKLRPGSRAGMAAALTVVLVGGLGVYWITGSFRLASQPGEVAAATPARPMLASDHQGIQIANAIASLRAKLEKQPDNPEGWRLLARSYATVGNYAAAVQVYQRLMDQAPADLALQADYAEALIDANGGIVGPGSATVFRKVLVSAPGDPRALYYLALREAQNGRPMVAARAWAGILRNAPPDAPYRPAIRGALDSLVQQAGLDRAALDIPDRGAPSQMATSAPGPTAKDIAAASSMSADDRLAMIRGMVEKLRTRLDSDTGDVAGWLRLARAQTVLGEPDTAVATLERALRANPGNRDLETALSGLRQPVAQ